MSKFISPPDKDDFNLQVWQLVCRIPHGKVTTYGRIAAMLVPPAGAKPKRFFAFGARWVGGAMANCPSDIPWWRVVNAQGKISTRPNAARQRELLEAEGVVFDAREKIDLAIYLWEIEPKD